MNTVTLTRRFQVAILLDVRRRMNLVPGSKLSIVEFNGGLHLLPLGAPSQSRGLARGTCTDIAREADRPL